MKTVKYLSMMLFMVVASVCFSACGDDDESPSDLAEAVSGVYTGKLTVNNSTVEDAYVVSVSKISSTVVHVTAEFFEDGGENYNIRQDGSQYIFSSESSSNITISVTGKSMSVNFLNKNGSITTFIGTKD